MHRPLDHQGRIPGRLVPCNDAVRKVQLPVVQDQDLGHHLAPAARQGSTRVALG